ncbi:radical SAM protein [Candidatus Bathyarchaeota archaeon]|nr:radical SAM protein [Candidatus Bathyarchaeota archaeon]
MKFSFINPSLPQEVLNMCTTAWPPLGILYCAGVLMKEGIEVSILDQAARGFSLKQTLDWVGREDPDVLGYSALYRVPETAEYVKENNPNITIIFGNYYATFNAERVLNKYPFVDVIVRGEGEYTCLELAKCLEKEGSLKEIKGITFRNGEKVFSTPDRPLIKDVDSLPFPDRELMDTKYTSTILGVKVATKKFTSLLSSRGCPFNCRFCGCRKFARGMWRPRSVENIIKELELLKSQGYEQFIFVDDTFTLNPKRVTKLCQEMRKEKIDMEWFCDSRVDTCRFDVFREMVEAGCRSVYFGIESANQRILNYYRKGTTFDQSKNAVYTARKAGIDVIVGSFIVGAPNETGREIQKTLKFINKLDIDVPSINVLRAFPGTDLWKDLIAKGCIDEDKFWETGVFVSQVSPHAVPFEKICSMIHEHFQTYYIHPKYLLKEISRTLKSSFRMKAVLNNLIRLNQMADMVKQGIVLNY